MGGSDLLKMLRSITILTLLMLLIAGCGGGSSQPTEPSPSGNGADGGEQPAPAEPQKQIVVGVSLPDQTNPLYVGIADGMKARGEELGVEVRILAANQDQGRQINQINDLITQQVDVIVASPLTVEGAVVGYEDANRAGIPILSIARNLDMPDLEWAMIGADWQAAGKKTAEWIAERLNGEGKIGVLSGPPGASFAMDQVAGLEEVVAANPGMEIVANLNSPLTLESGLDLTQNILTANPEQLDAIFAVNDDLALGAAQAVEEAGRAGQVIITGFNGNPPAVEAITQGRMHVTTALKPFTWGKIGLDAALEVVETGEKLGMVPTETLLIDESNAGQLTPEDLR